MWAVPWAPGEVVNTIFLLVTTVIVVSVPTVYALKANLRDPLARAILAGTGATGVMFIVLPVSVFSVHLGWKPGPNELNWIARLLYMSVAGGKLLLLLGLIRVLRETRGEKRDTEPQPPAIPIQRTPEAETA